MIEMPNCRAWVGEGMSTGRPRRRISPPSRWCTPPRMRISVDFPAPFSPTSAWTSPARTSNRTSCRACTPGKALRIPRISSCGAATALRRSPHSSERHPTMEDNVGVGRLLAGAYDRPHVVEYFLEPLVGDVLEPDAGQQSRERGVHLRAAPAHLLRHDGALDLQLSEHRLDGLQEARHAGHQGEVDARNVGGDRKAAVARGAPGRPATGVRFDWMESVQALPLDVFWERAKVVLEPFRGGDGKLRHHRPR